MTTRYFVLLCSLGLAVTLAACSPAQPPGTLEGAPNVSDPLPTKAVSAQDSDESAPEDNAGFESQPGPSEDICATIDFTGLDDVINHLGEPSLGRKADVLACTFYYTSEYIESVKPQRPDLREDIGLTRAIYLSVASVDEPPKSLKVAYPEASSEVGAKSGRVIEAVSGRGNGRPGMVQVHSGLEGNLKLMMEIDSIQPQAPRGDELFPVAMSAMDTILANEIENGVLRDAVSTPVAKAAGRTAPNNEAEEVVLDAINAVAQGDLITAADRFTARPGLYDDWFITGVTEPFERNAGEGCEVSIVDSSTPDSRAWAVVTDVSQCAPLYEQFFYEDGFKEVAYVAWAVGPVDESDPNFWIWARGDAAPTVGDARFSLEMKTLEVMPEGWTSPGHN